jgi:hypothetical protein
MVIGLLIARPWLRTWIIAGACDLLWCHPAVMAVFGWTTLAPLPILGTLLLTRPPASGQARAFVYTATAAASVMTLLFLPGRGDWHLDALLAGDRATRAFGIGVLAATAAVLTTLCGVVAAIPAALGRPAILLAASDDQLPVGPPFASTGAAIWLGDGRTIDPDVVRSEVAGLLADDAARAAMSASGRQVVDGSGADRLAAEIAALADGQASAS